MGCAACLASAEDSTARILFISSSFLESFGIDKLRGVEMRKKYAAGQQL
jgi:hypothetical protein